MGRFVLTMLIPIWVFIYTVQFARWVRSKKNNFGAAAAFVIGVGALVTSGWVLWRMTLS